MVRPELPHVRRRFPIGPQSNRLDHLGKAQIPGLRFKVDPFDSRAAYVLGICTRLLSTGTGHALEDLKLAIVFKYNSRARHPRDSAAMVAQ